MRPCFRSDLTCSREEQQGVVFYRVDDPRTQTSFRLYEIEYVIAQKLDGKRSQEEVIAAVKQDHNFDISDPDLTKFVTQLESMGFLAKDDSAPEELMEAEAIEDDDPEATQIMRRRDVHGASGGGPSLDLLDIASAPVDEAELKRLLKSAMLHVRQGYIVHARDYFLAARELAPNDQGIAKLVSTVEVLGDSSGPAELEMLWKQASELFPDIAEEVGPLAQASDGGGLGKVSEAAQRTTEAWDADLKARLVWVVVFLVVVLGGGGGLYFFAKATHIFEGAVQVSVTVVKAKRLPIFHDKPAEFVQASREAWLKFAGAGKIADVAVRPGMRVAADQVVANLELAPAQKKQLDAATAAIKKAEGEYQKAADKLARALEEREGVERERASADTHLEELKPKNVLSAGGASKRDIEKWKKVKAKAAKKLSQLAKKERQPRAAETKAKQKLEQVKKTLAGVERGIAQKFIRAPFAGTVVEVKVSKGQSIGADAKVMLLRDTLEARLAFLVKDAGGLAPGGEAFVAVSRGLPSRVKVAAVQQAPEGKRIEVTMVDPAGSFVDMPPTDFKLVREFIDPAFEVPATAVYTDERGGHVFIELQGRAIQRDIEVLSRDPAFFIVRDHSGALRDGEHVVTQRLNAEGGVASIVNGSFLELQN